MSSDLSGIAEFAAVVEEGSFTAAARRLSQSKSLVSERVSSLEARLGMRLQHRTTRRVAVTEAGTAYFEHCRRILREAASGWEALQALGGEPRGILRLACPVGFSVNHLMPALPDFHRRYPHIEVAVHAADTMTDLVAERIDVAVRAGRRGNPNVVIRTLAPLRFVIVAGPDYLARRGAPERPADVPRHDSLIYEPLLWGEEWRFHKPDGTIERTRLSGRLRTNSGETVKAACLAGLGLALFPTFEVSDHLHSGRLVAVLRDHPLDLEDRAVYAVFPDNLRIPPKVRAFVDFLAARIGDPPYWDRGL
jgi:DNA-binding transcriptional LysR family regulator